MTSPLDEPNEKEPTVVHLVPHTHWDREWYEPFQTFRMRLVELIDQLLVRMAEDPRLRFHASTVRLRPSTTTSRSGRKPSR